MGLLGLKVMWNFLFIVFSYSFFSTAAFGFFYFREINIQTLKVAHNTQKKKIHNKPSFLFLYMEFSSIWYFSFWSLVSLVFSSTGKYALRKATIPVSDLVKIPFEYLIAFSLSSSISYAFLFRPALEHDQELSAAHRYKIFLSFYIDHLYIHLLIFSTFASAYLAFSDYKWKAVLCLVSAVWFSRHVVKSINMGFKYSEAVGNPFIAFTGLLIMHPYHTLCWGLFQGFFLLFLCVDGCPSWWDLHLQSTFTLLSIPYSCTVFASYFKKLITTSTMVAHAYEHRKIIEIVFGMLGTTLAQYYFRVKSMSLMLGLLSLAIAWLAILANVQPYTDFGIFHFLVIAGLECVLSLFGLHFYTFLVVCGGIVLMVLRWKMEFVLLRHFGVREEFVRDWKLLEELYGNESNDSSIQTHHLEQPSEGASNTQRLGIQRRLTQRFERLWSPYAGFGA